MSAEPRGFKETRCYYKQPGDAIGPYLVRELLGAGSEGHVYKALDLRTSEMCTVKLLRGRNMEQEAAHTAWYYGRLASVQSLKRLRDWGVLKNQLGVGSRPWLAFDYIWGNTLPSHLRQRPAADVSSLALQIAEVVRAIHEHGLGVGDFDNGRNVLVTAHTNRVVLCDADAGVHGAPNRDRGADLPELSKIVQRMYRWQGRAADVQVIDALRCRSIDQAVRRLRSIRGQATGPPQRRMPRQAYQARLRSCKGELRQCSARLFR